MKPYFDNSKLMKAVAIDTAEQLLTDLIEPDSDIEFIKYNSHLGVWQIQYKNSDTMEFDDFHELYEFLTTEGLD